MKKKSNSTILSVAAIAAFYAATSYVPAVAAEYNISDNGFEELRDAIESATAPTGDTVQTGDTLKFAGNIENAEGGSVEGEGLTPNANIERLTVDGSWQEGEKGVYSTTSSAYSGFTTNSAKEGQILNLKNLSISGFNTAIKTAANGVINLDNVELSGNTTDINNAGTLNINGAVVSQGKITSSGNLTINSSGSLTANLIESTGTVSSSGSITNKGTFTSAGSNESSIASYKQTAADGASDSTSTNVTNGTLTFTEADISKGFVNVGNESGNSATLKLTGNSNSITTGINIKQTGTLEIGADASYSMSAKDNWDGTAKVAGGSLTVSGAKAEGASLVAESGTLSATNITLNNASDRIASSVKATVNGLVINKDGASVILTGGEDKITGNLTLSNGALTVGGYIEGLSAEYKRSGAITADGGTLTIASNMVFDNSSDSIGANVSAVINADTSIKAGSFALGSTADLSTAATVSVDGGLLDLAGYTTSDSTGAVKANSGKVEVTAESALGNAKDVISAGAELNVKENLTVSKSTAKTPDANATGVYLNSGDKIVTGKSVTVSESGVLTADGFKTGSSSENQGSIKAVGGELDIASGGLTLGTAGDSINGAKVVMDGNLTVNNGSVVLDGTSGKDLLNSGTLSITNGSLSLSNYNTTDGIIFEASKGGSETNVTLNGVTLGNTNDSIADGVKTIIGSNGLTINLVNTSDTQNVTLTMGADEIGGNVTLTSGNLAISGSDTSKTGAIIANGGKLKIAGATTLSGNDVIAKEAVVNVIDGDLIIASGEENYLNAGDTIAANRKVEVTTGGKLTTDGFKTTSGGGSLQASAGELVVGADGLTLANGKDTIAAGADVEITGNLTINNTDANGVTLNGGDTWNGKITQDGGTLNLAGSLASNGLIEANGGNLNIGSAAAAQNITLAEDSIIKTAANVNILNGSKITVSGGEIQLDNSDIKENTSGSIAQTSGKVKLEGSASNKFSTEKVSLNVADSNTANVTLTNVELNNASDVINAGAVATVSNLTINAGEVTLNSGDKISGDVTLTSGTLNIGGFDGTEGKTKSGNIIANAGSINIIDNMKFTSGDEITLNSGDSITQGKTAEFEGAKITLDGYNTSDSTGSVNAGNGSTVEVTSATTLANENDTIAAGATLNVNADLTVSKSKEGAGVTLNSGDSIADGKKVAVDNAGILNVDNFSTTKADAGAGKDGTSISATGGTLNVSGTVNLNNTNDTVDGANLNVADNANLNINGGSAVLTAANTTMTGTGKVTLSDGSLSVSGVEGTIIADGGELTIAGATTLSGNSVIAKNADVNVSGGNLTIASNQDNYLDSNVTIEAGKKIEVTAGGKVITDSFATTASGGSLQVVGGEIVEKGLTFNNAGDKIESDATATIQGDIALNAGSITLNGTGDGIDTLSSGTITVDNTGSLTVSGFDANKLSSVTLQANGGEFTLESGHFKGNIQEEADVYLKSGSTFHSTGETTLDSGDEWLGDIVIESGHVVLKGVNQQGNLSATGGIMEIGEVDTSTTPPTVTSQIANVEAGQTIAEGTKVILTDGIINVNADSTDPTKQGTLYLNGVGDADTVDTLTKGTINVDGGKLIMSDLNTNGNVKLTASKGDVSLTNVKLNNAGDSIAAAVNATVNGLEIANADAEVTLNNGDDWAGNVTLTDGTLNLEGVEVKSGSTLTAEGGTLNVGSSTDSSLTQALVVNTSSTIDEAVAVKLNTGSSITVKDGGSLVMKGGDDVWNGDLAVQGTSSSNKGELIIDNVTQNGKLSAMGGELTVTGTDLKIGDGSVIADSAATVIAGSVTKAADGSVESSTKGGSLTITAGTNNTGEVTLSAEDTVNTSIVLGTDDTAGGVLNLKGVAQNDTTLVAKSGSLNLSNGQNLAIVTSSSSIQKEVIVDIGAGTKLTVANGGVVSLNQAITRELSPDSDNWKGEVELQAGGELTIDSVNEKTGWLTAEEKGTLKIEGAGFTANNAKDSITADAIVELNGNLTVTNGAVVLNGNDSTTGAGDKDTFTKGVITVSNSGDVTVSDLTTTADVSINAEGGSLTLEDVNLNGGADTIKAAANVTIQGDDGLTISNATTNVILNDTNDSFDNSKITLTNGTLSLTGAEQGAGVLAASGGNLNIGVDTDGNKGDQIVNIGTGSSITDDVKVTLDGTTGSTINVKTGGNVALSQGSAATDDTLTKGTMNLDGGELTLTNVTTSDDVKLTASTTGTLNLSGVTLGGSSDTIADGVTAVITNGITINKTVGAGVTLTGGDDSIAANADGIGVALTGGNLTIGNYDTSSIGAIQATGGNLTIGNGKITLDNAKDEIQKAANLVIKSDLEVKTANAEADKFTITLDKDDSIEKTATVTLNGGSMQADGFKTTAKADTIDKGNLDIQQGKLDIAAGGLELNNEDDKILTAANVTLNGNLTVKGGEVELDSSDTLTKGVIKVDGGTLTATGISTAVDNSVSLNAASGKLIADGLTLNSENDTIAAAVTTEIGTNGLTINKTLNTGVTLNDGDSWTGKVTLNDGNLTLLDVTQGGELNATGGSLNIGDGTNNANITVSGTYTEGSETLNNKVAEAATVKLAQGSTLTAGADGVVEMDSSDTWNGALRVTDGGTLTLLNVAQGSNATLSASGAGSTLNVGRDADPASGVLAVKQDLIITGSTNSVAAETNVNLASVSSITTKDGGALEINAGDSWKGSLINNAGGTLTLSGFNYDTVQDGGKLIANAGNLNIAGASVVVGNGSIIKEEADVIIAANTSTPATSAGGSLKILEGENGTGSVTLGENDIWNGEILLGYRDETVDPAIVEKGGKLAIGNATTGDGATLKADSGELTIKNDRDHTLVITGDSFIKKDVITNLEANSSLQIDGGDVVLSENSTWDTTALVTVNGGKLQYVGIKQNGVLKAEDGILIIGEDPSVTPQPDPLNTKLTVVGDSEIKDAVQVTVNGELNIESGTINLDGAAGSGQDTLAGGFVHLNQAEGAVADLTLNNLDTTNAYLVAERGNLTLNNVTLNNINDYIDYEATVSLVTADPAADLDFTINRGTVKLDGADPLLTGTNKKTIILEQLDPEVTGQEEYAMLGVDGIATGDKLKLDLRTGHLEIEGDGLTLNNADDTVKQDIVALIKGDLTMNTGKVYLDGGDEERGIETDVWEKGNIALSNDAKLQFKNFEADSSGATKMTMENTNPDPDIVPAVELIGSKVNVADAGDIKGGNMILDANSVINLGVGSYQLDTLKSSGTVNTINGAYENYVANDIVVLNPAANTYQSVMDGTDTVITDGNANFAIDLFARTDGLKYNSDTFSGVNLTSDDPNSEAVITINDWVMNGRLTRQDGAVDPVYHFKLFDYENIDENIKFAATDKEQFTPIGYYRLFAEDEPGNYKLALTRFNKQVFRGQVVTQAQFRNQQAFDDMVTSNVLLHGSRKVADLGSNRFALATPELGPYQYTAQEGGLWMKSYADVEKLHFNQDINANNIAYGVVVGADFPMLDLKKGWKFIPTPYIGYNGAHQAFNGVSTYQYGGQLGFMGTFMKGNFISSNTIYGGGYYNDMHVDGVTDSTANWFWGTANKMAYNWTIKRHFTIQPTMFLGYTMYGPQNYHTEFGNMGMKTGMLNGINVAPGMNFIYAKRDWSLYAGLQYFYNINDQVSGQAGNVNLPSLRMRHGYIQYGLGATKNIKDELAGYAQVMWRNGGRTGLAFQLGLQYYYDIREIGGKISDSYSNFKETREQKAEAKREAKRASIITSTGVKAVPVSNTTNTEKKSFSQKVKGIFKKN